jgi:hypothetical protein
MLRKNAATTRPTSRVTESFREDTPGNLHAVSAWEKVLILACTYSPRGIRGGKTRMVKPTLVLQDELE